MDYFDDFFKISLGKQKTFLANYSEQKLGKSSEKASCWIYFSGVPRVIVGLHNVFFFKVF